MNITTKEEAKRKGETQFFTGIPCPRGHLAPRYVANGGCLECMGRWAPPEDPATNSKLFAVMLPADLHATAYAYLDLVLAQSGRPLVKRDCVAEDFVYSQFEQYVAFEVKRDLHERRSLEYIESSAVKRGYKVEYKNLKRPVDTWTLPPEVRRAQIEADLRSRGIPTSRIPMPPPGAVLTEQQQIDAHNAFVRDIDRQRREEIAARRAAGPPVATTGAAPLPSMSALLSGDLDAGGNREAMLRRIQADEERDGYADDERPPE